MAHSLENHTVKRRRKWRETNTFSMSYRAQCYCNESFDFSMKSDSYFHCRCSAISRTRTCQTLISHWIQCIPISESFHSWTIFHGNCAIRNGFIDEIDELQSMLSPSINCNISISSTCDLIYFIAISFFVYTLLFRWRKKEKKIRCVRLFWPCF